MKIFTIIVYILIIRVCIYAQTPVNSIFIQDQNPNYKKSKDKYVKPYQLKDSSIKAIFTKSKDSIKYEKTQKVEPSSLSYYEKELRLLEISGDQNAISLALFNLATAYFKNNNLDRALEYYLRCLSIQETFKDKQSMLGTLNAIGNVYSEQKQKTKAEEYYNRSSELAKKVAPSEKVQTASDALSKIYAKQGNYKNAYEMHQLYQQVTDSLYAREIKQTQMQNQLKYKFTQRHLLDSLTQEQHKKNYQDHISIKEAQVNSTKKITYLISIGLLLSLLLAFSFYKGYKQTQKTNKIISLQNKEAEEKKQIIQNSLEEKEILLKEIHHRVKNNLQIISSLLSLQTNRTEDEGLKKIMSEAKNRINSMSLIHQKIYQSGNLTTIDFQAYIEEMAETIESMFNTTKNTVSYTINTNSINLDIDTAIPLGLIINELLTNSYKYAFNLQEKPAISITLQEINTGIIELHVSDNGTGIPKDIDIQKSKSLGLKLVKGLSDQLKGTFRFENKEGAHFFMIFKKH